MRTVLPQSLPQFLLPEEDLDFVRMDNDLVDDLLDEIVSLWAIGGREDSLREPSRREEDLLNDLGLIFRRDKPVHNTCVVSEEACQGS